MKLVAMYIHKHEYMFSSPQTINFGSKYHYSFEVKDEILEVTRKENPKYVDTFEYGSSEKATMTALSAIGGQNGSGKSTVLDLIRTAFVEYISIDRPSQVLFFEACTGNLRMINQTQFKKVRLSDREVVDVNRAKLQPIYYSPHLDLKYHSNHPLINNYDLSLDVSIIKDLEELEHKDTDENGGRYSPYEELQFQNSLRQLWLLRSEIVKQKEIKVILKLPDHGGVKVNLKFRGYDLDFRENNEYNFYNTPYQFRDAFQCIDNKMRFEIDQWTTIRRRGLRGDVVNQIDINKYRCKRSILRDILSILFTLMEKRNDFLEEGNSKFQGSSKFENNFEASTTKLDAKDSFLSFVESAEITIRRNARNSNSAFNYKLLSNLIEKIYACIDAVEDVSCIENKLLVLSPKDAIEILEIQRDLIADLSCYYGTNGHDRVHIDGFINYTTNKKLSSGENAMLNLFSKIYALTTNKERREELNEKEHLIILLDEADLGFHPTWKKKYIKSLLNTLPHFFAFIKDKVTIQLIFTTHDPLTLSDVFDYNVVYLHGAESSDKCEVLDVDDSRRPSKSFGANITDLLANSFFVKDGLIGDFTKEKINKTIEWLNDKNDKSESEYNRLLIENIDEPIIRHKLAEMFSEKMEVNLSERLIEGEIAYLQSKLVKIKADILKRK